MSNLFKTLTPVSEVLSKVRQACPDKRESACERLPAAAAVGRILAEDVFAPHDLPGFDRSTVDGYAVVARDTFGASESLPAYLKLRGQVIMGSIPDFAVSSGEAVYVPTGGALPRGADAVVMIEYTAQTADDEIEVMRPVTKGENVIFKNEDVTAGQRVLTAGTVLRPEHIGLLQGLGIMEIAVKPRLKTVVFSTGDEIVPPESPVVPGKVRDMNGPMLVAALTRDGCDACYGGILPDSLQRVTQAVASALADCELVIISGGSSVGQRDVTAQVIDSLGPPGVVVHGVAIKPGKPTIVGLTRQGKMILGLPGHPVSAQIVYTVVVGRLLEYLLGAQQLPRQATIRAVLARSLSGASGRDHYVRVKLMVQDGELRAVPVLGESGLLSTLAEADGLVVIPATVRGFSKGELVEVIPLE